MKRIINSLILFVACLLAFSSPAKFNYCTLCENHVACNNNKQFAKNCKNPTLLKLSSENIKTALNAHNRVRNTIAGGGEKGFPAATKMAALRRNDELASFAELNVKRCTFGHDGCIKSSNKNFIPGQNIYMLGARSSDINQLLENAVALWYDEVKNVNPRTMKGGGHFTQVVRDQCKAIGCAIAYSAIGTIVTCNYSFGNIRGRGPVYVAGKTATDCKRGRDLKFKNLCKA